MKMKKSILTEKGGIQMASVATYIVEILIREKIVQREEQEIYCYGMELLLYTCLNASLILLLGFIFQDVFAGVLYFLVLATVRTQTGGYHASSYMNCGILYCTVFILVFYISELLKKTEISTVFYVMLLILNLFIMWKNAPVLHKKSLCESEKKQAVKRVGIRGIGWIIAVCGFSLFNESGMFVIGNSMLMITAFMIIGKYAEKRGEKE